MILVDTSVWVDHLELGDQALAALLENRQVLGHPFVVGEIALGNLRQREVVLDALCELPQAIVASTAEILEFIGRQSLAGIGIGYVDVHLLAAVHLTNGAKLWTRDRTLQAVATRLGIAAPPAGR